MYLKSLFFILPVLISLAYCELSIEKKEKLLNGFIDFYNKLPNEPYTSEEGTLHNVEALDDNKYNIEATLRVADVHNLDSTKFLKCTGTVQLEGKRVSIGDKAYHCQETEPYSATPGAQLYGERAKRQVTGGVTNQDPNQPRFFQLAEESLQKYLQSTGNTKPHQVVRVDKATVQVVAGTITRLDFTVKPLAGYSGDVIKCHSEIWEQPWINKKEIDVNCQINNAAYRAKRQLVAEIINKDPNDPKIQQLAQESLQKYLQITGNLKPHQIVRVDKASEQLVAGILTRLDFTVKPLVGNTGDVIKCHSEIWEQSWINKKDIDVKCQINNAAYRVKRQLVGGTTSKDPNDPKILQLAEESLQKYLQITGNLKPHQIVRVDKASEQLVAGILTRLDFTVKPLVGNTGDVIICHSEIWEQSWINKKDIDVKCQIKNAAYRAKRQLVGGTTSKDPNDPKIQQLAAESLQKYLQITGNTKPHQVVRVDKATEQLVAGTLTRLDFTVKPLIGNSGDVIKCHSEIWEQSWINKKDIDVNCYINY